MDTCSGVHDMNYPGLQDGEQGGQLRSGLAGRPF